MTLPIEPEIVVEIAENLGKVRYPTFIFITAKLHASYHKIGACVPVSLTLYFAVVKPDSAYHGNS